MASPQLIHVFLKRYYTPRGTFGHLELPDGWTASTVERNWVPASGESPAGQKAVSCVPEDTYVGVYLSGAPEGPTWALTSDRLKITLNETDESARSGIILKPSQLPSDVIGGCIGVGLSFSAVGNDWSVQNCQDAMTQLIERTKDWAKRQKTVLFHIRPAVAPRGVRALL